jgi:HlyD family secretion protein
MRWVVAIVLTAASGSSVTFLVWRSTNTVPNTIFPETKVESTNGKVIEGIGYVEPASEVRHLSPKSGGVIKECYVKVGDVLSKGDPVLTLHDEKEVAAVAVARKQLELAVAEESQVKSGINRYRILAAEKTVAKIQAEYNYAAAEAGRFRRLASTKSTSQSDFDLREARRLSMEAALKQAEADLLHLKNYVRDVDEIVMKQKVAHAKANLELAEQQLRDLEVLAPFDGTVLKLLKRPGEGVRMIELEPVVLFGDLSSVRVRAEIDERFVMALQVGQAAEVYGRNLFGKRYPGKIVEVEKIMGDKTVFSRASSERKDLHIIQVVIEMEPGFSAPVGLQVDVRIRQRTNE